MNDHTKFLLSAAFELGLPTVLAITAIILPRLRKWIVVILGSVTPLLLFYIYTAAGNFLGDEGAQIAFASMWFTSIIPFVACAVFGAVLAVIPVPRTISARYVFGLIPPAILAVAWAIGIQQ